MIIPGVSAGSGRLVVAADTSLTPPVVVRLPWSPGCVLHHALSANLPVLLLSHLSLCIRSDLAGRKTLPNNSSDSGGLRIERQTSLSFVVGAPGPVGVEPDDGAQCFAVDECALLSGLDHDEARRLVYLLTGSLGEERTRDSSTGEIHPLRQ